MTQAQPSLTSHANVGSFPKAKEEENFVGRGVYFGLLCSHPLGSSIAKSRETSCLGRQTSCRSQPVHTHVPLPGVDHVPPNLFQGICTSIAMCYGATFLVNQAQHGPPRIPRSKIEHDGLLEQRRQISLVLSLSCPSLVLGRREETLARA